VVYCFDIICTLFSNCLLIPKWYRSLDCSGTYFWWGGGVQVSVPVNDQWGWIEVTMSAHSDSDGTSTSSRECEPGMCTQTLQSYTREFKALSASQFIALIADRRNVFLFFLSSLRYCDFFSFKRKILKISCRKLGTRLPYTSISSNYVQEYVALTKVSWKFYSAQLQEYPT
jgi:hypothetical protein